MPKLWKIKCRQLWKIVYRLHDFIEIIIEDKNEIIKVYLTNEIDSIQFSGILEEYQSVEASLNYLHRKFYLYSEDKPLLEALNTYKKDNIRKGSDLEGSVWLKLYHSKPVSDQWRDQYHATWIDYEKQLLNGDVIYDEKGICGLYATTFNMKSEVDNEICKNEYGDKVFVVGPVEDCEYFFDGMQIIGAKFRVLDKLDFEQLEDINENSYILTSNKKKTPNKFRLTNLVKRPFLGTLE